MISAFSLSCGISLISIQMDYNSESSQQVLYPCHHTGVEEQNLQTSAERNLYYKHHINPLINLRENLNFSSKTPCKPTNSPAGKFMADDIPQNGKYFSVPITTFEALFFASTVNKTVFCAST